MGQHQLDQCTFMFMNGTELVGLIGVYVDDFLVAATTIPCSQMLTQRNISMGNVE